MEKINKELIRYQIKNGTENEKFINTLLTYELYNAYSYVDNEIKTNEIVVGIIEHIRNGLALYTTHCWNRVNGIDIDNTYVVRSMEFTYYEDPLKFHKMFKGKLHKDQLERDIKDINELKEKIGANIVPEDKIEYYNNCINHLISKNLLIRLDRLNFRINFKVK